MTIPIANVIALWRVQLATVDSYTSGTTFKIDAGVVDVLIIKAQYVRMLANHGKILLEGWVGDIADWCTCYGCHVTNW